MSKQTESYVVPKLPASAKIVLLLVDQDAITSNDVEYFWQSCMSVPEGCVVIPYFVWEGVPYEDVCRVPTVQRYVREALQNAPIILSRFSPEIRCQLRCCVLGKDAKSEREMRSLLRFPIWQRMCAIAGTNPWE